MKLFKTILKIVGILLGILVLIIGGFIVDASIDKTDTFYLNNGELENSKYLLEVENELQSGDSYKILSEKPSVYAHRLKEGKGIIFGYRLYSNGSLTTIDDEHFEKLTIWLSGNEIKQETKYRFEDSDKVIAVYTDGGSAWPRNACAGYLKTGSVTIRPDGKSYKITVDGTMEPKGVKTLGDWCKAKPIKKHFLAKEIKQKNLSYWLGKASDHPYKETYRR